MNRTQQSAEPTPSAGMSPAALLALRAGDEDNYLAAALPGGIERQEKQGQLKQASLQTLPTRGLDKYGPYLQSLGFVIGPVTADVIFTEVQFPEGWKKLPTDHSMWTDLVDDKGRVRGMIFYKAAFYDRSAHFSMSARFCLSTCRETITANLWEVCVLDGGVPLKSFGTWKAGDYAALEDIEKAARVWLDDNFPGWHAEDAYRLFWDITSPAAPPPAAPAAVP